MLEKDSQFFMVDNEDRPICKFCFKKMSKNGTKFYKKLKSYVFVYRCINCNKIKHQSCAKDYCICPKCHTSFIFKTNSLLSEAKNV